MIWPFKKKRASDAPQIAVQFSAQKLHVLVKRVDSGQDNVERAVLEWADSESGKLALKQFVESNHLQGAVVTVLLSFNDYQMLLVDAPPVEPVELAEALKWKVKDLIAQPLAQSMVEGFLLPDDAFRGSKKMAYAAAAAKPATQLLADACQEMGLFLERVGVAEMTIMDALQHADEHPAIVVVVAESGGFMSMIADGATYLVRKFDITHEMLASGGDTQQQAIERLVLDIQRSRDYFESQMGKGVINRLVCLPVKYGELELDAVLQEQMGLPVESLMLDLPQLASAEQYLLSAAVGVAPDA